MEGAEGRLSPEQLAESVGANLRLTLPGRILETDATSQAGNTPTWALPITGGEVQISAVSDPTQSEGGGFPLWVIIVIAAAVVAGIGFIVAHRPQARRGGCAPAPEMPSI